MPLQLPRRCQSSRAAACFPSFEYSAPLLPRVLQLGDCFRIRCHPPRDRGTAWLGVSTQHPGTTTPFRGRECQPLPGNIAEANFRLGGPDQPGLIRGEDPQQSHLDSAAQRTRHKRDGKSFDRRIARSSVAVAQFIAGLDELIDAVCGRLGRNKWHYLGANAI